MADWWDSSPMNEPEVPAKKGWGCLQWGVVGLVIVSLSLLAAFILGRITMRANQVNGVSNARQIIGLNMTYASDCSGLYPDSISHPVTGRLPQTSNEVFRALFQVDLWQDERLFSCPGSRFMGDNNIGMAPNYDQALIAGEKHWVMVAGMSTTTASNLPLILENAVDASWPPTWFADKAGQPVRGRAWENDTILIGFNDASVEAVKLEKQGDRLHLPKRLLEITDKKPLPELKAPVEKLLDIEEEKGSDKAP